MPFLVLICTPPPPRPRDCKIVKVTTRAQTLSSSTFFFLNLICNYFQCEKIIALVGSDTALISFGYFVLRCLQLLLCGLSVLSFHSSMWRATIKAPLRRRTKKTKKKNRPCSDNLAGRGGREGGRQQGCGAIQILQHKYTCTLASLMHAAHMWLRVPLLVRRAGARPTRSSV